jgi:hypothetical protein
VNKTKALLLAGAVTGALMAHASASFAEELPWAGKPLVPQATAPAGADQATADAAAGQCSTLFEAACRDLKTCSWIADIALQDGTLVPARCVARPAAPPKTAKKQQKTPAKKAADPVAVKTTEPQKPKETKAEAPSETKAEAIGQAEAASKPDPIAETPSAAEAKQADTGEPKKPDTKSPVVVTAPKKKPEGTEMPSFGSISPVMPGSESNAVVVTVPGSQ